MPREDVVTIHFRGRVFKVGLYGNSKIKPPRIKEMHVEESPPEAVSEFLAYILGREIIFFELEGAKVTGEKAKIALVELKRIIDKYFTEQIEGLDPEVEKNLKSL